MRVTNCRVCESNSLSELLNFGDVALADSFLDNLDQTGNEKKYPLTFIICKDCGHLQIGENVDPEILFRDYIYVTGVSPTILRHTEALYDTAISMLGNREGGKVRVHEVASNDGTVLNIFKNKGCDILGIEPATNIAKMAVERGIPTINKFFNLKTAQEVVADHGTADICIARNCLAHVIDLHGVVAGFEAMLSEKGIGIIEVPHALTMHEELQYDQIFHEHISYFSVAVLQKIFNMHNLSVFHVEEINVHGGSIRVFFQNIKGARNENSSVARVLQKENKVGLTTEEAWKDFSKRVNTQKELLLTELKKIKSEGKTVAVYGASGKGQSLLQFCGIDTKYVDFVVDKSSMKQGKYTPGTYIPIYSTTEIMERKPDVLLLCAWNFSEEIYSQQTDYINQGGKLLHPIPVPHYL